MSIRQAAARGITKIRRDNWAIPEDHVELHVDKDGNLGPWVKMWSPMNEEMLGENPYHCLIMNMGPMDEEAWEEYKGD